jgi:hypothetical protein
MIKNIINYVKKLQQCISEDLRYELGTDFETTDIIKKKIFSSKYLNLKKEKNKLNFFFIELIKNKSDLIYLIKNSFQGINILNLFNCYINIKNDLIDLIKFNGKDRFLILIKGKYYINLMLFYYSNLNYISNTTDDSLRWHKN